MSIPTLNDPVFGKLTFDVFWEGQAAVPPFGTMWLSVETEDDDDPPPPTDEQRAAFQQFVATAAQVRTKAERANIAYLNRVRDAYTKPPPSTPAALWNELSDATVHIPPQDGESWRVELNFNCSWDVEHGHAVYVEDGEVVHVGIQGEGFPD